MKRIAFVDDEPEVLRGLQRAMDLLTEDWDLQFFDNGEQVLEEMAKEPFDAVVTDMRMPGMSGNDVIDSLNESYPDTARIILSGQSSREATFRAIHPMHLYLSKPCDNEVLESTINRALALGQILHDAQLKSFVHGLDRLPSKPELYEQVRQEMDAVEPSIRRVGEIVQQDVAMTAKILQLANSARYGLRRDVQDVLQAATVLGMETIRDLVLSAGVAMQYADVELDGFHIDDFCDRSLATAKSAKAIASKHGADKLTCEEAFTAGLLCDIGQLMLIGRSADAYQEILNQSDGSSASLCSLEEEAFGCDHASLGAYALGTWGMPQVVIEAVGFHHRPQQLRHINLLPVTAVHVAAAFGNEKVDCCEPNNPAIDHDYLRSIGVEKELADWIELCEAPMAK